MGERFHERARCVDARTANLVLGPSGPSRYHRSARELHDCVGACACLRRGIDDGVEHRSLVEPSEPALHAVVDVERFIDHATEQLGAAHIDPDYPP